MKNFIDWLYATPLSVLFQTTEWFVPVVQSIHIFCIAALFTSMLMLDLRLLGVAGTKHSVQNYASRFLPWLWGALPIMLFTGILLIITEPDRDLRNTAFYVKMTMLIVACLITYGFQRALKKNPASWEPAGDKQAIGRLVGLASMLLWIGIIVSGRLIAYV